MQTCCHRVLWQQETKWWNLKWVQRRTMGATGAWMTEHIETVSPTEIISLLSCGYSIPLKHLIFAQLLICAPLFMSSLFTFPAAQFTCCCWDYPAHQASKFLLLKQLLCSVCFEHSEDSMKDWSNIFCLTGGLEAVKPIKAVLCWECIWQAPARLKSKLLPFFDLCVRQFTYCWHLSQSVFG